jgi:hypothetical protein
MRTSTANILRFPDRVILVLRKPPAMTERIFLVAIFGGIYGAIMGAPAGWLQVLYSAIKVPILLTVTFALSVPSYFILSSLAGLRADFPEAIRAIAAAQAGLSLTLASLSPFTALWYLSCTNYNTNILFNGLMFAVATAAAQTLIRRFYRPLILRNSRHRTLRNIWMFVYSFVAIQMAWTLRPFVGNPNLPTHFFRHGAWGNAYVFVANLMWNFLRRQF